MLTNMSIKLIPIIVCLLTYAVFVDDAYCMDTEQKMDSHLMHDIVTTNLDNRLETIISRNNPIELQRLVENLTRIVTPIVDQIDTGETAPSLRDNIRGYESIIIWATVSILGFILIRYGSQIFDFLSNTASTILQEGANNVVNINPERIRALVNIALNDPRTRAAVIQLIENSTGNDAA